MKPPAMLAIYSIAINLGFGDLGWAFYRRYARLATRHADLQKHLSQIERVESRIQL